MLRTLIISALFLNTWFLCKVQELPPFYGEWWSDSISVNGENARQFVFVTSEGRFYRCSYETESYIIDRALEVESNFVIREDGAKWHLEQPTDKVLMLKGPGYYGRFKLNYHPHIISIKEGIMEFVVGDSVRQLIQGNWVLKSTVIQSHDPRDEEDSVLMKLVRDDDFLWAQYKEKVQLRFTKNRVINMISGSKKAIHEYIVDDEELAIRFDDLIIDLPYKLQNGELWLSRDDGYFEWTYIFKRDD